MPNFNKRIFGSNISAGVQTKLKALQEFSYKANPNESIESRDIDGKKINYREALGNVNFKLGDDGVLAELSSRTPWVRMWCAVQLFMHIRGENKTYVKEFDINTTVDGIAGESITSTRKAFKRVDEEIKKEENATLEKKVYIIGNHNYNELSTTENIHNPIIEGGESRVLDTTTDSKASDYFPNEGRNKNEFHRPPAGITSVTSTTEGTLGAIKRTTVEFMVHNFHDYQDIYSKYFLKPGAIIFLDFGWDNSAIYSPQQMTEDGDDPASAIYGDGGPVQESNGDLEVVIGRVVGFDSKLNTQGSYECSIELISENSALLSNTIEEGNHLKDKLTSGLTTYIISRVGQNIGWEFLRKDWSSDLGVGKESEQYAATFANKFFGSTGTNTVNIPAAALKVGLYWQSIEAHSTEEVDIKKGTFNDTEASVAKISDGDDNVYISWAFFEEELLNRELATSSESPDFTYGSYFDSGNSWIVYDTNLVDRQNIISSYSSAKTNLKFLYPPNWNETYNTTLYSNKVPDRTNPEESSIFGDKSTITTGDIARSRMPLRELFINVSVIRDAFGNNNNVDDAIKQILDTINDDSHGVLDLKLVSGQRDGAVMSVIDRHFVNLKSEKNKFDDIFIFKPFSPTTIVQSVDLSMSTPENGLQSMIAIQNTSTNIPIFPATADEAMNNELRKIYGISMDNPQIGIKHLPQTEQPAKDSVQDDDKSTRLSSFSTVDNPVSGDTRILDKFTDMYTLISKDPQIGEDSDLFLGLKDNATVFDDESTIPRRDMSGTSKPPEIIDPDAIYANDLEEYFGLLAQRDFYADSNQSSTILPLELSLTIRGIGSLVPGDIFTIDYLPSQYRENVYFQLTKVSHNVTKSGWTTTLDSVMRMKPNQFQFLYKNPIIYMSKSWLHSAGIPGFVSEKITNIKLSSKTVGGRLPIFEGSANQSTTITEVYNSFSTGTLTSEQTLFYQLDRAGLVEKKLKVALGDNLYIILVNGGTLVYKVGKDTNIDDKITKITETVDAFWSDKISTQESWGMNETLSWKKIEN